MYRVAQKSINLKYFVVLMGIFRFKLSTQYIERCHRVVSCALNIKDLNPDDFCKLTADF
jgi:hypothetical protein